MSKPHYITPTGPQTPPVAARLGSAAGANFTYTEEGKLVKLVAESAYDLCAQGDLIHARLVSVSVDTAGGWSIGGVNDEDMMWVTADGLQATPGTGNLAVGDFVVCGTVVAKGTKLPSFPRVCKATTQLGTVPGTLTDAGYMAQYAVHAWQVVSLGPVGTGAPGTAIVIKPLN